MALFNRNKQKLEETLAKLDALEKRAKDLETDILTIGQSTAILAMSPDGLIHSASERFLDMLGYTHEALVGQHHRILCDEQYANSETYMKFWQALVIGQTQQGRFTGLDSRGQAICLDACYAPIMSEKRMVQRVIATISNVSWQ